MQVQDQIFEIRTHNGFITLTSHKTGEHRTLRVWTQHKEAKFKPGERLIGLLTGPDNESDYRSFGVLGDDGEIYLWRKHQDDKFYQWIRLALLNPERFLDRVSFSFEGHCRRCNRLLTDPISVASGLGPTCRQAE